ncbi:TM1266 family iron-only hydrogenase system putative regulator [Desulforamulus aeronauticus]|uniref:Putative iron-only hydrogenase system regulator n=1 Tax=Desulforamulus aeronauticus DSM 10349 TaxID=1121421 RepID=A0A1M6QAR7_9FIRM|nr:TM1266 family iron-only hydrogenase system putative regulator [Desulforamulus aeronauticus]SHK17183.1 putative iron-only hydrogenase system regulator [Desulforamulus aeronauticus DSM 10349]
MNNSVGGVVIVVEDREKLAPQVNSILTAYGDLIVGRVGLPYREKNKYVITIVVDGEAEVVKEMVLKLEELGNIQVKVALSGICNS